MMRILLLGGTGYIGSRVAEQFLSAGHQVAVVHRGRQSVPPGSVSLIVDRREPGLLTAALAGFHPEALIDMIAYTVTDVDGVLPALPEQLRRVTLISSGDVYQAYGAFLGLEPPPSSPGPAAEGGLLRRSRYPYRGQARSPDDLLHGYDKILVEERYRDHLSVPVTTLRLPMVYGPGDPHQRVAGDLCRLRDAPGGLLQLHPAEAAWRCTRGYVDDVAAAIALATVHPGALGKTYNVGELDPLTTQEWLAAIAQAFDVPAAIRSNPSVAPSHPADWTVSVVSATGLIRNELGYVEPVGRAKGLRRTARAAAA
jgi:nucleoside-diphosphate-sugar epimerase